MNLCYFVVKVTLLNACSLSLTYISASVKPPFVEVMLNSIGSSQASLSKLVLRLDSIIHLSVPFAPGQVPFTHVLALLSLSLYLW